MFVCLFVFLKETTKKIESWLCWVKLLSSLVLSNPLLWEMKKQRVRVGDADGLMLWVGSKVAKDLWQWICCFSVANLCLTVCNSRNDTMPGFPALHYLPEFAQTHVPIVSDAIEPPHPLSPPSPPALCLSQNQGLLHWIGSSHQVAKVLETQDQSFQWIFRFDFP